MSLLTQTHALLKQHLAEPNNSLRKLADRSNDTVEYEWLVRFARGEIKNPGVISVQALHDLLVSEVKRRAA